MKNNNKHFYSHLIEIEEITIKITKLKFSEDEKNHLISLLEHNLHHGVIDTILTELETEDKKIFLHYLSENSHEKIWKLLKDKVKNVEHKVVNSAKNLLAELEKDLEKL